ncbi:amino acid permease [Clostridium carboxidivorans P7]|uniref:Amino acid permease-associated region n=1 Tax=Clostridium carboxidivorans P7 TaxID=536227 RepID=C6PX47_9CLOT|nr:APC family permease [Clostridium carboxidivorans]AKN32730.1 amino acid permease [Clostridium carboxidivorans P7]EET86164.1 amino acid permease-associated region [Clostridium carboxidivorans P7]EFG90032.1 amino acid permease [Clostridium carboxidivorans P7]
MDENKKLGLFSIILLGINSVIGTGIFLLPGNVYKILGPGSLLAYLLVLLLVMSMALCFAEASSMFQRSGGPYLYARAAFGEFIGFEVGTMKWVVSIIAWATMAVGFVTALAKIVPAVQNTMVSKTLVACIILGLGLLNLLGVNLMKFLNNIATIGKLVPLVLFIAVGLFFLNKGNFTPLFPYGHSSFNISEAVILVFYAFTGFENIGVTAGDMKNPEKNIPKAIIISMTLISIIYFLVQLISIGTLGVKLHNSTTPVADAMASFLGGTGGILVTMGTLISIAGINIAASFITPRCAVALAEDNLLPKSLAKTNKKNAPYIAVILTVAFSLVLAMNGSFTQLAAISVIARFSQYIPTCLSVIILRKKRKDLKANFRVPFGPVIPIFAVSASAWLIFNADKMKLVFGLGAMIILIPIYFIMKNYNKKQERLIENEI